MAEIKSLEGCSLQLDRKRLGICGSGFIMLSKHMYTLLVQYIDSGRSRAPPEYVLGELVPTFQDGAKTDRRALQSKFKSWSKRMDVKDGKLILASNGKLILPKEECDSVIMDLHLQDHCIIDDVILRIQEKYTWNRKNFGMDLDIVIECLSQNCRSQDCYKKLKERLRSGNFYLRTTNKQSSSDYTGSTGSSSESTSPVASSLNPTAKSLKESNLLTNSSSSILPMHSSAQNFPRKKRLLSRYWICNSRMHSNENLKRLSKRNVENKLSLRPQLYPNGLPLSPILKQEMPVVKPMRQICTSAFEFLKALELKSKDQETISLIKEEKSKFLAFLNLVPIKVCSRKKMLTEKQRLAMRIQMMKRRSILQRSGIGRYNLRNIRVKKPKSNKQCEDNKRFRLRFSERLSSVRARRWKSSIRDAKENKNMTNSNYSTNNISGKRGRELEKRRKTLRQRRAARKRLHPEVIDISSSSSSEEQQVPCSPPILPKIEDCARNSEDQKQWRPEQFMFGPGFYPHVIPKVVPAPTNTFTKFTSNAPRMASFIKPPEATFMPPFMQNFGNYARRGTANLSQSKPFSTNLSQPSPILRCWKPNVEGLNRNVEPAKVVYPWNNRIPNIPGSYQMVRMPSEAKFFVLSPNRLPGTLIRMPNCGQSILAARVRQQQRFVTCGNAARYRNLAPKPVLIATSAVAVTTTVSTAVAPVTAATTVASVTTASVSKSVPNPPILCFVGDKADANQKAKKLSSVLKKVLEDPTEKKALPKVDVSVKRKDMSWSQKAINLSRLIQRLKANLKSNIFQEGKERNVEIVTNQLDVGLTLVRQSRQSLYELEKSQDIKKEGTACFVA